jgi:putative colanic acid biosynthesis UDP-glucose lipid carrier transferase
VQPALLSDDGPIGAESEIPPTRIQTPASVSALSRASVDQKVVQLGAVESAGLALLRHWSKPLGVLIALVLALMVTWQPPTPAWCALAVASALISRQLFSPLRLLLGGGLGEEMRRALRLLCECAAWIALLLCLGLALGIENALPRDTYLTWFALTPACLLVGDYLTMHALARARSAHDRHIIIGANEIGMELARRISQNPGTGTFLGFFDFRSPERLPLPNRQQLLGTCKEAAAFVQRRSVNAIYIALPMSNAPRIEAMLHEFRDTTASIYFVPDMFEFDLVQARCAEIHGIPMLAICDTPFHGMNAVKKRAIDILLSSAALLLGWPVLLAIAIAVKLSSRGPVLLKQRRYGLHGEEILVYKFRTMTVCEDGAVVVQAKQQDRRVTGIGRLLRRASLDELPQLINILRGTMSFVGPRPHAVAHNELYRRLISGYMIRHKVRPGMTGWAQVHGLRGETPTVEQMRQRVEFDLDYLRNWSPWLDVRIILKTAAIVFLHRKAY